MSEVNYSEFPNFIDYIDQILHLRSARIVKRRAGGASLRDVAVEEGITRTEARQQEKKALARLFEGDIMFREDSYRYLYEHYNVDQEFFDQHENGSTIQYYLKSRYEAGFMSLKNALNDSKVDSDILHRIQAYYHVFSEEIGEPEAETTAAENPAASVNIPDSNTNEIEPPANNYAALLREESFGGPLRELPSHIFESIDALWDIFKTGGITDDLKILEQISIFLFLKVLDDKELAITAKAYSDGFDSGKHYFDDAHLNCRWSYFQHLESMELFDIVKNHAFPYIKKDLRIDTNLTYAKLSSDLKLHILDASMLARIISAIDELTSISSIRLSQLFDAMISKVDPSSPVLKLVCQITKPTIEDSICNPFMGLAYNLSYYADYISENYSEELQKIWNKMHFQNEMFYGFSKANDNTILRIAALRMMLRGIETVTYDSLDVLRQDTGKRYSKIITELPVTVTVNQKYVKSSIKSFITANQPHLMYMYACQELLDYDGICTLVLPHKCLTDNSASHRKLRKFYVESKKLLAIISLPDTKQDILIYQNCPAQGDSYVWFARLGTATPTDTLIEQLIEHYQNADYFAEDSRTLSFWVPLSEIKEKECLLDYEIYGENSDTDTDSLAPEESFDAIMRRVYNTQALIDENIQSIKMQMEGLR